MSPSPSLQFPQLVLSVNCDGGARGNPGPGASAFILTTSSGQVLYQQGDYLGRVTNNQAEYAAVAFALDWIVNHNAKVQHMTFFLDSLLVVNQLKGQFKIKDPILKQKKTEIEAQLSRLSELNTLTFTHIPRSHNSAADLLVNQTLDNHSDLPH